MAPTYPITFFNLGFTYQKMGNLEDSIKFYKMAISLNPDYFDAYYNLAFNYYGQKEYEKAFEAFKRADLLPSDEKSKKAVRDYIKMITEKIKMQNPPPQQ